MKATTLSIMLYLGIFFISSPKTVMAQCDPTLDSLALVALYKASDGPNWNQSWDTLQPLSTWYGVTLTTNGCIQLLDLDGFIDPNDLTRSGGGNNLIGSIPSEIWNLSQLTFLGLTGNNGLNYSLPTTIDNLSNIKELSLQASGLSGSIPTELGNITSLTFLDFSNNQLTGAVPPSLNNLNQLEILFLYNNQLNGLPNLSNLSNLRELNFSNNTINGAFPNWVFNLDQLANLDLAYTELTGSIDYDWSVLPALFNIRLKGNELNGPIPASIGALSQLWQLDLSFNQLTGEIPSDLANFQHGYLYFNDNLLSGSIPNFSTGSSAMINLDIQNNNFTFEDILPHLSALETMIAAGGSGNPADDYGYGPQKMVYKDTMILKVAGDQCIIDLGIDDPIVSNSYQWYKYGQPLMTMTGNNTLTINSIQASDLGIYSCEITNPNAPNLTLNSYNITLEESTCNIALTLGAQTACDPRYNTYSQNITITHTFDPFVGFLVINGINYPNLPSPFTISLSDLSADGQPVNVSAHFSEMPTCMSTINGFFTAPPPCPEGVCEAIDLELNTNGQSKNVYQARDNITSKWTISPGNDIVFRAGESITLTDGFHAVANATFVAEIMPCDLPAFQDAPELSPPISAVNELTPELSVRPNPFQGQAKIQYQLTDNHYISLRVYSLTGKLIHQFEEHTLQTAGSHDYNFSAENLKGGTYMVVLQTDKEVLTKKVIIIK